MNSAESSFKNWAKTEYTTIKPGLERMRNFFKITGRTNDISRERGLSIIHIAGTNGKGSVASYIASILKESGLKTGLYTSPHLISVTERIQLNGKDISETQLEKLFNRYSDPIRTAGLTFFETMTAIAIIYFSDEKTDIAVMEVGVGGKFDATNICQRKLLSIITSISKDHTDLFGDHLKDIASEDIGIISENTPLVAGKLRKDLQQLVRGYARRKKSPAYFYGENFNSSNIRPDWQKFHQDFDYIEKNSDGKTDPSELKNLKIPLMGDYQTLNASLAVKSALLLRKSGGKFAGISDETIRGGLFKTRWPARFQIVRKKNGSILIIDGAHNEEAVKNFTNQYLKTPFSRRKTTVIFGCLKEKDHRSMTKHIATIADKIIIAKPNSPRAQNPTILKESFLKITRRQGSRLNEEDITITDDIKPFISSSCLNSTTIVLGSLYLAADAIKKLHI